jgi:hypothetical protein
VLAVPEIRREAMKALLLLTAGLATAILPVTVKAAEPYKCSWSTGTVSSVPCAPRLAKNYEACRKYLIEHGEMSPTWWCTSQGYKN